MNYEMIKRAEDFARYHFNDVVDKDGAPYMIHCKAVSEGSRKVAKVLGLDEVTILACEVAGMLHDVLEDTAVTKEQLAKEFDPVIADIVDNVSKRAKGVESNDDYYVRVESDIRSTIVKFADTNHNGQLNRLSSPSLKMVKKCANYARLNLRLATTLGLI